MGAWRVFQWADRSPGEHKGCFSGGRRQDEFWSVFGFAAGFRGEIRGSFVLEVAIISLIVGFGGRVRIGQTGEDGCNIGLKEYKGAGGNARRSAVLFESLLIRTRHFDAFGRHCGPSILLENAY